MRKKFSAVEKLDQFSQGFIDDLFDMSDEDLISELEEAGNNVEEIVSYTKGFFVNALSNFGKSRLTAARTALSQEPQMPVKANASIADIENARDIIKKINIDNSSIHNEVTLAARNLDTLTDEEILSLYSDLVELGLLEKKDSE